MALLVDPIIMKLMSIIIQADGMAGTMKVILCVILAFIGTFLGVGLIGLFVGGD